MLNVEKVEVRGDLNGRDYLKWNIVRKMLVCNQKRFIANLLLN